MALLTDKQLALLEFVKLKHGEQVRKYNNEPYYYHLLNVAYLVQPFDTEGLLLVEVSLCHDLLEDTNCTENELLEFLMSVGYNHVESTFITKRVIELTDVYIYENYSDLNRKERKTLEALRMSDIYSTAQTVKYADLIDNSSSICEHDKGFAKTYLQEKKELLRLMKDGNFDLYLQACSILYNNLNTLK